MRTMHPYFNDKLYNGSNPIGHMAEYVTSVLNTASHVYHVSPVFSVMEVECVKFFGSKFGMPAETIDGVTTPGGSTAIAMSLLAARHEKFPHVRSKGWQAGDNAVAFTSAQSHYAVSRGAMLSGMGMDQMRQVPCDRHTGQMSPEALEEMIKDEIAKGNKPFYLNSVAGSTVMGSFDDMHALADICEKYGMWFNIDACWGGFLAFADG